MVSLPRVIIAATRSGEGKTTVATGIMAALRAAGLRVSPHKVGPDYIDTSYHAAACGVPGRNLDPWLTGEELVAPLLLHGARSADVAVIEGVMGLFDGAAGRGDFASTAHVARLTGAPVVLVVGAAGTSRSIAATVHGFASWDPRVDLAGVVLNQVSSDRHEAVLREALGPAGIPVLGALRREATLHTPSRHLGLVPAGERAASVSTWLPALRELIARHLDLAALMRIARGAPELAADRWSPEDAAAAGSSSPLPGLPAPGLLPGGLTGGLTERRPRRLAGRRPRIAVAAGPAFTFGYAEHDELLTAAGADVVTFDPLADEALPAGTDALVVGGGFPEVHVDALTANAALREDIRKRAAAGMPIVAECAGLLWLGATLNSRPQCALVPAAARMTGNLTLGYREATALRDSPLLTAGSRVRAHEFHHTVSEPAHGAEPAWQLADGSLTGWAGPSMLASYLHLHWAGLPQAAARLVRAARAASAGAGRRSETAGSVAGRRSPAARDLAAGGVAGGGLAAGSLGDGLAGSRLSAAPQAPVPAGSRQTGAGGHDRPARAVTIGQVTLVGAGPGSADLITLRGWQALQSADVVISDRLVDSALTAELRTGVVLIDAGKKPGEHRLSQQDISAELVAHARAGRHVVRLKGGDPFVLGRGGEEVLACAEAGIPCSVVPGLSSATAAPALAGIPLTHRGLAQSFAVISGHLPPGHPDSPVNWESLARSADTLVLLMAVANITSIARHLIGLGRPAGTDVACIEHAATARQQVSRCTLGDLAGPATAPAISSPAVIVIGPTVRALLPLRP